MSQIKSNEEGLREWLRGCPELSKSKHFRFNYLGDKPTEYTLFSSPSTVNYRENVLGEMIPTDIQTINYIFATREQHGADALQNMENLKFYNGVMTWIIEQNSIRHFPEMLDGTVRSIVPTLTPYVVSAGTDAAQYQIQIQITYRRK